MRQAWRGIAGLLAVGALTAGGSVALADNGGVHGNRDNKANRGNARATTVFTMPGDDGNPEGIASDKRSGRFFVSRTGTGAIFSGRLGTPALAPFIGPGTPGSGPIATGMKVRKGLLYVAGATTGEIRVYNLATPAKAPAVFPTGGKFINDLDVTERGDIYATDSFSPTIYKVDAAAVKAGSSTTAATPINVAPEITVDPTPGVFNLNGIVASHDGGELIVVQSNTGKLYRITFGDHHGARAAPVARKIEEIDLGTANVKNGDGLLVDRGRLLVVRGSNGATTGDPATNGSKGAIDVVKLSHHRTRGRIESEVTDATFAGPSTIARVRDRLLVVNANFAAPAGTKQFTVSSLARNAVRHGRHGGRG
jgi:sugar lactone lactonase YvrE